MSHYIILIKLGPTSACMVATITIYGSRSNVKRVFGEDFSDLYTPVAIQNIMKVLSK